tara:strand:+ start:456 stop:647 length:192 start_codon:yes stop_codon:yes gene_type:complete
MWTISEICTRVRLEERLVVVEKLAKVAYLSVHLKDFFGANAISSGLDHPAVSRLEKTQKSISR